MDRTAVRSRVGSMDGATRIPAAVPLDRGQVRFRTLLFRYLAVGFILLATVVVANPGTPGAGADPDPWDYQREQVDVNTRTAANWQAYVNELTAAGVVPPPASAMLNPAAGLPPGLAPVAAARRDAGRAGSPGGGRRDLVR